MSRLIGLVGKSVNRIFGRSKEPKEEELNKNIQFIPAGNNYLNVEDHSKPKVEEIKNSGGGNQR